MNFLEESRKAIVERLQYAEHEPSKMSGDAFEFLVFEEMRKLAIGGAFEGHIVHTEDREFPDIVASGYYGIEVKATKKDGWTSIGNSVLESSRIKNVGRIFILFGKLGGTPDVKCRKYEDCLKGIAVTHYPRYQIDMNLPAGHSIFDRMQITYDAMRSDDNPIRHVRRYYRSQMSEGDALWWIDDGKNTVPELSPVIRNYASLDSSTKDEIKADIFILHPEILSNSSVKYRDVPAYLASVHGVVCSNVRDIFTAGGRVAMKDERGNEFRVPQIVSELLRLAPLIEKKLAARSKPEISYGDENYVNDHNGARRTWLYEANKYSAHMDLPVRLSEIYSSKFNKDIR